MLGSGLAAVVASAVVASAPPADAPTRDCALGFLAWCVVESDQVQAARPPRLRLELFTGYKPAGGYYRLEQEACAAAGCALRLDGAVFNLDAFVRLWGNPRSDDYFDLGLSYVVLPVVSAMEANRHGFSGELGPVGPGPGELSYASIRVALRRPSLFYLVKSKYLISSFGVGLAFPVARGAGATFTGADGPKLSIGGRLGVQLPLTADFSVGLATSFNVVWYGPAFGYAAYIGGYGVNLQWLWGGA